MGTMLLDTASHCQGGLGLVNLLVLLHRVIHGTVDGGNVGWIVHIDSSTQRSEHHTTGSGWREAYRSGGTSDAGAPKGCRGAKGET